MMNTNITNNDFTSIHPSLECLERIQNFFLEQPHDKFIDIESTVNNLKDLNYLTADKFNSKVVKGFLGHYLGGAFYEKESTSEDVKNFVLTAIRVISKTIIKEKMDKFIDAIEKTAKELGLAVKFKVNDGERKCLKNYLTIY